MGDWWWQLPLCVVLLCVAIPVGAAIGHVLSNIVDAIWGDEV